MQQRAACGAVCSTAEGAFGCPPCWEGAEQRGHGGQRSPVRRRPALVALLVAWKRKDGCSSSARAEAARRGGFQRWAAGAVSGTSQARRGACRQGGAAERRRGRHVPFLRTCGSSARRPPGRSAASCTATGRRVPRKPNVLTDLLEAALQALQPLHGSALGAARLRGLSEEARRPLSPPSPERQNSAFPAGGAPAADFRRAPTGGALSGWGWGPGLGSGLWILSPSPWVSLLRLFLLLRPFPPFSFLPFLPTGSPRFAGRDADTVPEPVWFSDDPIGPCDAERRGRRLVV